MKKSIVIFSGFNTRAVIAFVRTLEKNNIKYGIIAKSKEDEIFQTDYSTKVKYIRQTTQFELGDLLVGLNFLKKDLNVDECMVAPSTEALNRFFLDNINVFKNINCFMPLVNKNLYETISDKLNFCNICKKYNIRIPYEYEIVDESVLPLVAKPKKYFSSKGEIYAPCIINTKVELIDFINKYNKDDFYYQEYIEGRCIYLLYYFDKNGKVFKFSQENFIQQEAGKSMIYAKTSDYHKKDISLKFEELFLKENFRGMVMVELKVQQEDSIMIEANPRFWGPSQLFVDANYNFFEFLLYDYGYLKCHNKKTIQRNINYFWNDGILDNINTREKLSFYNYTKQKFINEKKNLVKNEIFNRKDTINLYKGKQMTKIEQLKKMYANTSKHSNYQILPTELENFLSSKEVDTKSRNEKIRLDYFLKNVDIKNKTILDIGGNTGYFTFEFLSNGAKSVEYYEGNKEHAEFVKLASEVIERENQVQVYNEYYNFDKNDKFDVILLLNVLHHIGDDFGNDELSREKALEKIIEHLNHILKQTNILVFQLGFNWKGDISLPLFEHGTKKELIDFITANLDEKYEIVKVGIAEKADNEIVFNDLNKSNIKRDDSLGEFLNRPIFIIRAK